MGRGTIAGGGAEGLYSVTLDYGTAARTARVAAMDARIAELNTRIAAALDAVTLAEARTQEALAALNSLIEQMLSAQLAGDNTQVAALKKQADTATSAYAAAEAAEAAARVPRDLMVAERNLLVSDKGRLQAALVQETRPAWCVDLTEDAAGAVATIEIPGEDQTVLIAPGGRAPTGADGRLLARELMSPEQVFVNAAILPGWQKWMPTYRKGTITWLDKDANLANVSLDAAVSSAAGLAVNQTPQLNGIPVVYMTCHAEAFEVGDRVVVQFDGQAWEAPQVIGFVDHPKTCLRYTLSYDAVTRRPDGALTGTAWNSLPAGTITGANPQIVIKGADGSPVSAPAQTLAARWVGWSDGNMSYTRQETNVQANAHHDARYIAVPAGISLNVNVSGGEPDAEGNAYWSTGVVAEDDPSWGLTINVPPGYSRSGLITLAQPLPTNEDRSFTGPVTAECVLNGASATLTYTFSGFVYGLDGYIVANTYVLSGVS